ncbi:UDP-glucose:glycoprotein glucosyltransferase-domain-containing protein [Sporodiniella umbellata]|nr:UDP-glucose:glycoprotein glucosyltransferase-domain-containing protein [Sporodiniella umbellata]
MSRISTAILSLITLGALFLKSKAESPTVDLTLVAPWSAPDFLLEIAETAGLNNESNYYELLDELTRIQQNAQSWTDKQIYDKALDHISFLDKDGIDMFKLSLALHEAAPRIEAYSQYYQQAVVPSISQYDDQCDVWVQMGKIQICNIQSFLDTFKNGKALVGIDELPFDHIIRSGTLDKSQKPSFALYTDTFSPKFNQFYSLLKSVSEKEQVSFVLRYKPSTSNTIKPPLYLSGFGVEMALKKTDYLVIDDRDAQDNKLGDTIKEKLTTFEKKIGRVLFNTPGKAAIEPLSSSDIETLGLKSAQYIAKSNNPLETMVYLSQDFPKYAKSISEIELDDDFVQEITTNQQMSFREGSNAIWINGKALEMNQMDPFYISRTIRSEKNLIKSIKELGFSSREAMELISDPALSEKDIQDNVDNVLDVRDTPENPFVAWWNDLENDNRYEGWPYDIMEILKPTYPGQLHPIRKNIYNLILVEDLASQRSLVRITNEVKAMVQRKIPIRFGVISFIDSNSSTCKLAAKAAQAFYYISKNTNTSTGMNFLELILEFVSAQGLERATDQAVKVAFDHIVSAVEDLKGKTTLEEALKWSEPFLDATSLFLSRMAIREYNPKDGIMFFNGKLLEFSEEKPWIHSLMPHLNEQTRKVQTMAYLKEFSSDLDYYQHVLSQPNVASKRNPYIQTSQSNPLRIFSFERTTSLAELKYFQKDEKTSPSSNVWVVSDFDTLNGLKLALEAVLFADSNPSVRVAFIHKPYITNQSGQKKTGPNFSDVFCKLIQLEGTTFSELKEILEKTNIVSGTESSGSASNGEINTQSGDQFEPVYIVPGAPVIDIDAKKQGEKWSVMVDALEADGLESDFFGIIMNGRAIGPLSLEENLLFAVSDFATLFEYEKMHRISPIEHIALRREKELPKEKLADIIMKLSAIVENDKAQATQSVMEDNEPTIRNRMYEGVAATKHSKVVINRSDDTFLEIGLIINPLSEAAQKIAPILDTLSQIEGVSVVIHLNPVSHLESLPLKRFYRYVFDKEPHFDSQSGKQETPTAYFANLPTEPLYTLGVETTNAWHVTVREANMDLDNIMLSSLEKKHTVSAVYELQSILVEGHCLNAITKSPPRGLQFELISHSGTDKRDTLVMANLGYFQFKALPGVWNLGLRSGRSSTVYSIQNVGADGKWNWNTVDTEVQNDILALTSFEGMTITPLVRKNPGMENEDVLESAQPKKDEGGDTGIWSSINQKIFGKKDKTDVLDKSKSQHAQINIFSVASGKLYERFLSIMMASVMNHTKNTVKFWFIENFLSPEFKNFVPHMANQYGFDYEMVTYKWPAWLRSQQEKQRVIWGYKILFLDVLFPLNLDKVIFVDADQIVRTDLKELVDLDLNGAPYGYTPFCSDRTEMDGFRFWKEGYWKSHLGEKPYHISALYVVDLVRFRELAAGDRLRAQYQQLSADPNSLANLDQDLPNNMQHIVPIHSLPQEWLWCETWCGDDSLKKAKTIDLCNNPLTREPKLDRARRQVPEWEVYDNEIDKLRKQVKLKPKESVNEEKMYPLKDEF